MSGIQEWHSWVVLAPSLSRNCSHLKAQVRVSLFPNSLNVLLGRLQKIHFQVYSHGCLQASSSCHMGLSIVCLSVPMMWQLSSFPLAALKRPKTATDERKGVLSRGKKLTTAPSFLHCRLPSLEQTCSAGYQIPLKLWVNNHI